MIFGDSDGAAIVGCEDGAAVVGIDDGPDVGMDVGSSEGTRLGIGDGLDVGAAVVGEADGADVGSAVGREVGTAVGTAVRVPAVGRAEDVGRPRLGVDASGPDHDGVSVDRHGVAEVVARSAVGGRQLGQLCAVARAEDVDRPRFLRRRAQWTRSCGR